MIIECILISSSLCNAVAAKPKHTDVLPKRQNAIVSMLKDRPVMALATLDLTVKTMDYRQTEQRLQDGRLSGTQCDVAPDAGPPGGDGGLWNGLRHGCGVLGPRDAHTHALASSASCGGCRRPSASSKTLMDMLTPARTTVAKAGEI